MVVGRGRVTQKSTSSPIFAATLFLGLSWGLSMSYFQGITPTYRKTPIPQNTPANTGSKAFLKGRGTHFVSPTAPMMSQCAESCTTASSQTYCEHGFAMGSMSEVGRARSTNASISDVTSSEHRAGAFLHGASREMAIEALVAGSRSSHRRAKQPRRPQLDS